MKTLLLLMTSIIPVKDWKHLEDRHAHSLHYEVVRMQEKAGIPPIPFYEFKRIRNSARSRYEGGKK